MQISKEQPMRPALDDVIDAVNDIGDIGPYVTDAVDDWLDEHPEATTTVQDNSLTTAKYQDGSVTGSKISNNAITTDKIADGAVTYDKLHEPDLLMVGGAESVTNDEAITREYLYAPVPDGAGDGLALIESICGNTVVQDGSLLPVRMEGVETVGFNQWDEVWEQGAIRESDGSIVGSTTQIRSKNFIPVFPSTTYCNSSNYTLAFFAYDANKEYIGFIGNITSKNTFTTSAGCAYLMFFRTATTYNHDICINLSDPTRNGTYEPYWSSQLAIPVATYFPDGMRSAGTVRDELTETQAITRVGAVDLGTLTWTESPITAGSFNSSTISDIAITANANRGNITCAVYQTYSGDTVDSSTAGISNGVNQTKTVRVHDPRYAGDAAAFKQAMSGVMLHYALATPTTTPIDPPLPLSYKVAQGGTERVMVPEGETSAPPIFATRYPINLADLAESIAPREFTIATGNHAIGDLIMLGWTLCKATQVIVTGETIEIGTNVTRTNVAAEIAALS